ncbi:MAG: apolipoprotein N-acyltransferase [Candidatus Omnitrophica bacterium]|nr:apolipoprotein N-acyltransferase [Candidatus Omnitrophota bacterium]HQP11621.1 apolipoprotein N-acyltransferase [Candidatus Omnitrophota bacterium]
MILFFILAVILNLSAFPSFLFSFGLWPSAWVCLIPLFFCLARSGAPCRRLLTGGLFGVCFYALLIQWFIPYSLPGYLFFVVMLSIQPLIFALFFSPPFSSRIFRLFYWPALWTGSEYVRQALLRGFSWNLGCSQAFNLYVLQWASLGGSFLLSFFLVLCNTCFYEMAEAKERRLFYIKVLAAVNLLAWAGGAAQYYFLSGTPAREPPVRAAVVQAAADPREKLDADRVSRFVEAHVRLSFARDPFSPVDMIVWPETAVPLDPRQDIFLMGTVIEMCRHQGAGVLTGMAWEDEEGRLYNGAAWIGPRGEFFEVYRKQYLVPFSEEQPWPGRRLGAFIEKNWGKNAYHFTRGEGLGVLPLSFIRPGLSGSAGLAICSEDTVSALFRKYAHAGVDMMIVLLNDGWFQDSTALIQHAQNSILRAVEIRRPVLRAANSGWTCLIDPRGRVRSLSETGLMEAGAGVFELVSFSGRAPYVFIGDSFCFLWTAFVIISLLLSRVKKFRE